MCLILLLGISQRQSTVGLSLKSWASPLTLSHWLPAPASRGRNIFQRRATVTLSRRWLCRNTVAQMCRLALDIGTGALLLALVDQPRLLQPHLCKMQTLQILPKLGLSLH